MTYVFSGTPEENMAAVFEHIGGARAGGVHADSYFRDALISLVRLYDSIAQTSPVAPERLQRFRRESGESLASFGNKITAYVQRAIILAEGANDDEWYELCMRRSAIQSLLDDYTGLPVAALVDPSDVLDLDAEMRRVGAEQGPVPEAFVPKGLPESHWWWRYPQPSGPTQAEPIDADG
jgi:hypothetical protein